MIEGGWASTRVPFRVEERCANDRLGGSARDRPEHQWALMPERASQGAVVHGDGLRDLEEPDQPRIAADGQAR
jgi:hypothetical protein